MALPVYLKVQDEVVLLHIKAQPRASRNEIGEILGQKLKVKVTAPPVDSAANEAIEKFLAEKLGCPRRSVQIVRGGTSRHKVLAVIGMKVEDVVARLK